DQLVAIDGPDVSARFAYDGLGRRHRREVNGASAVTLFDGVTAVHEIDATGAGISWLRAPGTDEPFARLDANGVRVPLLDTLRSVVAMAAGAGAVHMLYTYEPFGAAVGAGADESSAPRFAGQDGDASGLYYRGGRYYHPTLHRFISEEPQAPTAPGLNRY